MQQLPELDSGGASMISMTNALGEMRCWVLDSCLMVAEVDPRGFRTTYQYDRFAKVCEPI